MNKNIKNILLGVSVFALAGANYSCSSDFLDEKLITKESTKSFQTKDGLDKLSIGIYQNLEFHFHNEWGYTIWQYGADEMAVGNDGSRDPYNIYSSAFDPSRGDGMPNLWDNMYGGITSANILIKNVPLYYGEENSADYRARLGEGYFMRGFNYLRLVCQVGGVPLVLEPVEGARTDYERNTAEECYAQIIDDLTTAYGLLPETSGPQTGRLTKWAAAHFIAKACLFRASEINNAWNGAYKEQDLKDVIKYGDEVIAKHPLCNDFVALWDYTIPNGPNESVSEVILAAQFSDDASSKGRYGNRMHEYYPSVYQNIPGLTRDISGDREFSRMRTTNYSLDVFDRVNDSRFWKSFITSYRSNNPNGAPKWEAGFTPAGKVVGDPKFVGGEEAVRYIINDAGDTRYTPDNIKSRAPHMYVRYFNGEAKSYIGEHGNNGTYTTKDRYVSLSKFRDGSRTSNNDEFGCRDGILARTGETYLMVAEAYGLQGNYPAALPYINRLRERAGYFAGEDREKHVDGGQSYKSTNPVVYSTTNTYWESNNMEGQVTTAETKTNLKFNTVNDIFNSTREFYTELGASSDAEKFMVFIMNERTRELVGELHRWPDLARTKQLEKRWRTFNDGVNTPGAAFDANKHYLRPIPQTFLDALEKGGQPLTSSEKQAIQNPGW